MTTTDSTPVHSEERVAELVDKLTMDEKIQLVHGAMDPQERAMGYTPPIDRLNIPGVSMVAGPVGVQGFEVGEESTAFPASIAAAATWDPALVLSEGRAMARECKALGYDVLLGPPGVNLIRIPIGGRNFEYFSEDPHLNSRMSVAITNGIQSEGVIATVKHYAANNHEANRNFVNAVVDERTLREMYLPGFRAAVEEADVGSVMSAYNKVNGYYASHSRQLLTKILKEEWSFDGFVMSDWWSIKRTVAAANAGMDLEMPGVSREAILGTDLDDSGEETDEGSDDGSEDEPRIGPPGVFAEPLRKAIEADAVSEERLDDMVRRILRQYERFGILNGERLGGPGTIDTPEHRSLARNIAASGTVLLKNKENTLPIDTSEIDSLAVIGPNADSATTGGGGSSCVTPFYSVSPLEGIVSRAPADLDVHFERGRERVADMKMLIELRRESDSDDGDDDERTSIEDATTLASEADAVIVFARDWTSEGDDQPSLDLPNEQNDLIAAVAEANDRTTVVLNTNGAVHMPWIDDVPAILEAWYPGQEDGNAIASILFGHVNPSGKLPVTFGAQLDDYPANTDVQYPGIDNVVEYSEGVFVGYRHFDEEDVTPIYPFGHGLSYTSFEFSDIEVAPTAATLDDTITVELTVTNLGDREGAEVVQLYVSDMDASVDRPLRELKAFEKVPLEPGEQADVEFELDMDALSFYDVDSGEWVVEPGEFAVHVGRSSRNIRLTETFEVRR